MAVDSTGTVYAAWSDCRFRAACTANDIVLARSPAPGVLTEPERTPLEPLSGTRDFLLPAITVQPETRGTQAHLALAHHSLTTPDCTGAGCKLTAGFTTSLDAGRSWRPEAVSDLMQLDWLARVRSELVGRGLRARLIWGPGT